ncbi:hypothetical protein IWW38_005391, partial [Coemansia aciculifera]
MSGTNSKRKKYSWLPESNLAAVSGESSSSVAAAAAAARHEPKDKRVRQPRLQTRGEAKQKAREKAAARAGVEGLGIMSATTENAPEDAASNSGAREQSANAIIGLDSEDMAVDQSPGLVKTPQPAPPKVRRKHRKDSVDEL